MKMAKLKIDSSTRIVKGKVIYDDNDGLQVLVKKQVYSLIILDSINNYDVIYSKPTNSKHDAWTERKFKGASRPNLVSIYWSPVRPKMKINVNIDDKTKVAVMYKDIQEPHDE